MSVFFNYRYEEKNSHLEKMSCILIKDVGYQITFLVSFLQSTRICDVLRDLVSFVQFKKREKHPWWSVIFSKITGSKLSCNASDMLLNPDIVEDNFSNASSFIPAATSRNHEINQYKKNPMICTSYVELLLLREWNYENEFNSRDLNGLGM